MEVVVERDLCGRPSPAFHWKQNCDLWYFRSATALPNLPLKAFKDTDSTAFLGSMFPCSTTHAQSCASSHNSSDSICVLCSSFYHSLLLRRVQLNDLCHSPSGSYRLLSDLPLFAFLPGSSTRFHKSYAVGHLPSHQSSACPSPVSWHPSWIGEPETGHIIPHMIPGVDSLALNKAG